MARHALAAAGGLTEEVELGPWELAAHQRPPLGEEALGTLAGRAPAGAGEQRHGGVAGESGAGRQLGGKGRRQHPNVGALAGEAAQACRVLVGERQGERGTVEHLALPPRQPVGLAARQPAGDPPRRGTARAPQVALHVLRPQHHRRLAAQRLRHGLHLLGVHDVERGHPRRGRHPAANRLQRVAGGGDGEPPRDGDERGERERPRPTLDEVVTAQRRQGLVDPLGVAAGERGDQVHLDLVPPLGQLPQSQELEEPPAVDRRPGGLGGHPEDAQGPVLLAQRGPAESRRPFAAGLRPGSAGARASHVWRAGSRGCARWAGSPEEPARRSPARRRRARSACRGCW